MNLLKGLAVNAKQIESKLQDLDFFVREVRDINGGKQIRLGCGAILNVYNKGTVLVQGKLIPAVREESLSLLKMVLPPQTRWCIN